ncbi:MAG: hypothetical protein U5L73_11485 [Rhodoferax sp.]|uniref:hypothetical protein n=1 Tax=Rhodoferax sp. TaxID=50421 RepID=UPI002ACDB9CD|nr:hypothetical protein [Rhodoferax sp.]MDZ7892365.1 hypothetical protein [Rhodoferax sp.]
MNAQLPHCLAAALAPFAPPSSIVHQIVSEEQAKRIDAAMHADKKQDGYVQRLEANAMRLQLAENARQGYAT